MISVSKTSWFVIGLLGICAVFFDGLGAISAWGTDEMAGRNHSGVQFELGSSGVLIREKRAPARHVGAVMAILGTFNEAGVLPAESDPRANQLIRSLIQFQSVFMKSRVPEVQEYFSSALDTRWGEESSTVRDSFYAHGWTSKSLGAVVDYSRNKAMWQDEQMQEVFRQYYLSSADWVLVQEVFLAARQEFVAESKDMHEVFGKQRERMARGKF